MKLIGWNCNMKFRAKADYILNYKPDLLVISECEKLNAKQLDDFKIKPNSFIWMGDNVHKGVGIFSFSDYRLSQLEYNPAFKYIIPVCVKGKYNFNLFGIWAMDNKQERKNRYIARVGLAMHFYNELLNRNSILLGDFNSNKIWDADKPSKSMNHSDVVKMLGEKNIHSVYHTYYNEEHGSESMHTLFMYRNSMKPYHIDYCFMSDFFLNKLKSVTVGSHTDWFKYSDHTPIIIDIQ